MLYLPFLCQIESIQTLTNTDKLFRLIRVDGEPFTHKPGQFVQVSIPGLGEAPISVASSSSRGDYLELGVRDVGALTHAMHQLSPGDTVGLRGPFGNSFPVEELKGRDILLIAGGCGLSPLRAVIQYIEDHRDDYNDVTILYGARSPDDVMYRDEMLNSRQPFRIIINITVDHISEGASCWTGNVGLITKLIPPLTLDENNTTALLCGPPIMYRFVIDELKKKGIRDEQIIVSLERHMKCGVRKCGHCTIEHIYCCSDGPVFKYSEIKNIRGAI